MPIETSPSHDILELRASGRITRDDYLAFEPSLEEAIARGGKLRVLVDMRGYRGMTMGAMVEDLKMARLHMRDIDRIAVIGDRAWEKWLTLFCRQVVIYSIRYFDEAEVEQARSWLEGPAEPPPDRRWIGLALGCAALAAAGIWAARARRDR